MNDGTLEFSFSGLKTAVINHIHKLTQQLKLSHGSELPTSVKEDIAAAFTKVTVDGICAKLADALKSEKVDHLVLAGGVAANSHIRRAFEKETEKIGVSLFLPPLSLCGDNAAMIGAQGYYEYLAGNLAGTDLNAFATLSIE